MGAFKEIYGHANHRLSALHGFHSAFFYVFHSAYFLHMFFSLGLFSKRFTGKPIIGFLPSMVFAPPFFSVFHSAFFMFFPPPFFFVFFTQPFLWDSIGLFLMVFTLAYLQGMSIYGNVNHWLSGLCSFHLTFFSSVFTLAFFSGFHSAFFMFFTWPFFYGSHAASFW